MMMTSRSEKGIFIHALREEGDAIWVLSRLVSREISIHALREEGDAGGRTLINLTPHFYPRPPRGGRRDYRLVRLAKFNISIHALREEGDFSA